jgi:predicted small secreted protein
MTHTLKLLMVLLALLALPSLSAYNTARGMGEDVQAAGRAMSGTAQDVTGRCAVRPRSAASL